MRRPAACLAILATFATIALPGRTNGAPQLTAQPAAGNITTEFHFAAPVPWNVDSSGAAQAARADPKWAAIAQAPREAGFSLFGDPNGSHPVWVAGVNRAPVFNPQAGSPQADPNA